MVRGGLSPGQLAAARLEAESTQSVTSTQAKYDGTSESDDVGGLGDDENSIALDGSGAARRKTSARRVSGSKASEALSRALYLHAFESDSNPDSESSSDEAVIAGDVGDEEEMDEVLALREKRHCAAVALVVTVELAVKCSRDAL